MGPLMFRSWLSNHEIWTNVECYIDLIFESVQSCHFRETRNQWHVFIQDAILEKCNEKEAAIVHISVDKASNEVSEQQNFNWLFLCGLGLMRIYPGTSHKPLNVAYTPKRFSAIHLIDNPEIDFVCHTA